MSKEHSSLIQTDVLIIHSALTFNFFCTRHLNPRQETREANLNPQKALQSSKPYLLIVVNVLVNLPLP